MSRRQTCRGSIETTIVGILISFVPVLFTGWIASASSSDASPFVALSLVPSLVLLFRSFTVSVTLSDGGIVIRNLFRSYRFAWRDVTVIEAGRRPGRYGDVGVAIVRTGLSTSLPWAVNDPGWMNQMRDWPPIPNTRARVALDASLHLGARKKAKLVGALRSFAARAACRCSLSETDLDSNQFHWTMREQLPKVWKPDK